MKHGEIVFSITTAKESVQYALFFLSKYDEGLTTGSYHVFHYELNDYQVTCFCTLCIPYCVQLQLLIGRSCVFCYAQHKYLGITTDSTMIA